MNPVKERHVFDTDFSLLFIENEKGRAKHSSTMIDEYSDDRGSMEGQTYLHFHDGFEIVYVNHGEGTFLIENQLYSMKAGDVFLIRSDSIHHPSPAEVKGYQCSVIIFNPELIRHHATLGPLVKDCFENPMPLIQFHQPIIQAQFENCLSYLAIEIKSRQPLYEQSSLAYLSQLLILIKREQQNIDKINPHYPSVGIKSQIWMNGILNYLDEHYLTHTITLQELADQALVSPEHFSRIFKKMTGMTLPSYVNLKKIHHAKQLLTTTQLSIQQVSESSGFNDVSYFTKKFKSVWGCQPSEIRR